jgi:predicted PurR-regulated permease PerM
VEVEEMKVSKIFVVLITVVVCVIIGAFVINILMPNTVTSVVDTVENQIQHATGISLDLNGNGVAGASGNNIANMKSSNEDKSNSNSTSSSKTVDGFQ